MLLSYPTFERLHTRRVLQVYYTCTCLLDCSTMAAFFSAMCLTSLAEDLMCSCLSFNWLLSLPTLKDFVDQSDQHYIYRGEREGERDRERERKREREREAMKTYEWLQGFFVLSPSWLASCLTFLWFLCFPQSLTASVRRKPQSTNRFVIV